MYNLMRFNKIFCVFSIYIVTKVYSYEELYEKEWCP